MSLEQHFFVRPVTAGDVAFLSVRARNAHGYGDQLDGETISEDCQDSPLPRPKKSSEKATAVPVHLVDKFRTRHWS